MKKMIVTAAIAAMVSGGFTASAKNAKENTQPATTTCPAQRGPRCDANTPCPAFDGINLTEAQKTQLKQLQDKRRTEAGTKRDAKRDAKQAAKAAKQESRIQARRAHLAEIKSILTPEQYVTFLENSFVQGKTARKMDKPAKAHKHGQGPRQQQQPRQGK